MNLESAILINNNTTFQTLIKFFHHIVLILLCFCNVYCNYSRVSLGPELAYKLRRTLVEYCRLISNLPTK